MGSGRAAVLGTLATAGLIGRVGNWRRGGGSCGAQSMAAAAPHGGPTSATQDQCRGTAQSPAVELALTAGTQGHIRTRGGLLTPLRTIAFMRMEEAGAGVGRSRPGGMRAGLLSRPSAARGPG